jgi:hypothetical protein
VSAGCLPSRLRVRQLVEIAVVVGDLEAVNHGARKDQEIRKRNGHPGGASAIGEPRPVDQDAGVSASLAQARGDDRPAFKSALSRRLYDALDRLTGAMRRPLFLKPFLRLPSRVHRWVFVIVIIE